MKFIDLTGKTFGLWTVIKRGSNLGNRVRFLCRCKCGTERLVKPNSLVRNLSKSCGCIRIEKITTHGFSIRVRSTKLVHTEYQIWQGMIARCTNYNNTSYKNYGGRGITVCKRWLKFENFLKDMGLRPEKTSLDRINNNKGYCKSNCRWATKEQQSNNRKDNIILKYKGKSLSLSQWARYLKIPISTVQNRYRRGFSLKEILYVDKFTNSNRR